MRRYSAGGRAEVSDARRGVSRTELRERTRKGRGVGTGQEDRGEGGGGRAGG